MPDSTRENPLWLAYREADEMYRRALKNYTAEFERQRDEACREIRERLRGGALGQAVTVASAMVLDAFKAYSTVHGFHPSTATEQGALNANDGAVDR